MLGRVKRTLEIVDFRSDVNSARECLPETIRPDGSGERRKNWQIIESQIYFGNGAVSANIANAQSESWIELRRIHELKKRALGIHTRDDCLDGDFISVSQHNAGSSAVFYTDMQHFSIGANFHAGLLGRFGQCVRESSETTARKSSRANRMCFCCCAQKQHRGGTRRPGPQSCSKNTASRNHSA